MPRQAIPFYELHLPPFGQWDQKWFLLTSGVNKPGGFNAMTVSWGGLGWIWGKPLAIVVVRPQRYTYEFMERCDTFSLCCFSEKFRATLNMLGSRSGRDTDKMAQSGLTPVALSQVAAPGFDEAELILECRKSYFNDLDPRNFRASYIAANYQGDYHRMYFGEVVAVSGTKEYRRGK